MARKFNPATARQQLRAAERKAEQEARRAVDRFKRDVEQRHRKVQQQNRQAVAAYNRQVDTHNREAERHNQRELDKINRAIQQPVSPRTVHFTVSEQELAGRVQDAIPAQGERDYDVFLSYAHRDGNDVARQLREALEEFGVNVWFDEVAIRPGKSLARQMDEGLRKARAGVVLITPTYLTGRLWPERELGALLHKPTVIPVLHQVSFDDVAGFSAILSDLVGFTTDGDPIAEIAAKIAVAVSDTEVI